MIKQTLRQKLNEFLEHIGSRFYQKAQIFRCNYSLLVKNVSESEQKITIVFPLPKDTDKQRLMNSVNFRPEPEIKSIEDRFGNQYIYWQTSIQPHHSQTFSQYFDIQTQAFTIEIPEDLNIQDYKSLGKKINGFLESTPSLQLDDVEALIKKIVGKEENLKNIVEKIYNYVINNLEHGNQTDGLHSSKEAKDLKCVDCGGFSTFFVSLCQAVGIPARIVSGFWAGHEKNHMHVWAELILPDKSWLPVDAAIDQLRKDKKTIKLGSLGKIGSDRIVFSHGCDFELVVNGNKKIKIDLLQNPIVLNNLENGLHLEQEFATKILKKKNGKD